MGTRRHSGGRGRDPAGAEQLAEQAATAAGWQLPRLRMMSQSAALNSSGAAAADQSGTERAEKAERADRVERRGSTWAQVRRLAGELTEVFDSADEGEEEPADGWVAFVRRYPMAGLWAGWVVLALVDWLVTHRAAPQALWLATRAPWYGGAEQAWRVQAAVASALVPLTQPSAVLWLVLALLSVRILWRCARAGVCTAALCVVYFVAADTALWHALRPASSEALYLAESAQRLGEWRAFVPPDMGGGPWALAAAAVVCVYAAWQLHVSAWRTCAALVALDGLLHSSACVQRVWSAGVRALGALAAACVRGQTSCVGGGIRLAVATVSGVPWAALRIAHCVVRGPAAGGGGLLMAHGLSTAVLLVLHGAAVAVHGMRIWYTTTVRERRRTTAVAAAHAPFAHRVCFLCLGGFCERCLLSLDIWPTGQGTGAQVRAPHEGLPPLRGLLGTPTTPPARRGRGLDAWIVSSVAHCPCRAVHGVGPSAFVPRSARTDHAQQPCREEGHMPPGATLVSLAQYTRALRSLGLVRPVDPASVAVSDDPTVSVLPMIFGRFTVPADPRAAAAANALLESSATSYAQLVQPSGHTPGAAPFLADASRILPRSTPLSIARAPAAATFRLCAEAIEPVVMVRIVVTPGLAHVLLSHPRSAASASVCVPSSLADVISAPARHGQNALVAAMADSASVDAFFDHVRVHLARADVVVRVDGARWNDAEIGSALDLPIGVRGLAPGQAHHISVTVLGMRSEDLVVSVPPAGTERPADTFADRLAHAQAVLDAALARKQAAQQQHKRARRDTTKQTHHCQAELDALTRGAERHAQAEERYGRRHAQLCDAVAAQRQEVAELRGQAIDAVRESGPSPGRRRVTMDSGAARQPASQDSSGDEEDAGDSAELEAALAELQRAKEQARRQQTSLEEALQGLKRQREQWIADLGRLAKGRVPAAERTLQPLQRELADADARLEQGRRGMERLLRQLASLDARGGEDLREGESDEQARAGLIRRLASLREALKQEHKHIEQLSGQSPLSGVDGKLPPHAWMG
ncbi:hypothetical protein GGF46_005075 [Coemansia sp. RSA 552]|nr:hypothetical protein GGF46_005075 [Coemansia sp. RSA 552]